MPTIFVNPSPADKLPIQYSRISLPLPRGAFAKQPHVKIEGDTNQDVATQSEVLCHWPDGSVRTVHLTLQGGGGSYEAFLEESDAEENSAFQNAIETTPAGDSVEVSTGRLHAVLGGAGLVKSIRLGNREVIGAGGIEVRVTDEHEQTYTATAAHNVETTVELAKPLRTVVALRGQCTLGEKTFLDFRLRFEFLAGVEGFSLSYCFYNLERGKDFWPVKAIELKLQLASTQNAEYTLCQQEHGIFGLPRLVTTAEKLDVRVDNSQAQTYVQNFEALNDETVYPFYMNPPTDRVDNWFGIGSNERMLLLEMDDFHLLRPKSLRLQNGSATFGVWPAEAGILELQQGRSREVTVRVALRDTDSELTREEATARVAQLRDVWRAQLRHDVYAEAKFFDQSRVLPFTPLQHPRFEQWLGRMSTQLHSVATFFDLGDTPDSGYRSTYTPLRRQRRIRGKDGGTRWFSSGYSHPALAMNDLEDFEPVWVNNEYDVIFAIGTEYLRTGDLSLFQKLRWFSRHTIEVDFLHYSDHKWLHRAQPAHSARHTTTGAYPSHFWTQGLAQYYMLTGDKDALEIIIALAEKTIENFEDPELGELNSGLNRETGWGVLSLVCAYEASGEKRFDDHARKLLDEIAAEGVPNDIPDFSFGYTSLLLGLRQYLQVHNSENTGHLTEYFLKFVDKAIACSVKAPPEQTEIIKSGTYDYDERRKARGSLHSKTGRNGIFGPLTIAFDPLAYAYEITGDTTYITAAARSLEAMVDSDVFHHPVAEGKPYAMTYRSWINFLKNAAGLKLLDQWEYK